MNLPTGITVEKATNKDIPAIKRLIHGVLTEYKLNSDHTLIGSDLENIEISYANGFFGLLKTSEDQIIATFALFHLDETSIELQKMYLIPSYRSRGLGKWMLHHLIQKAKDSGYKKLKLQTASVLETAIAIYRKTGFDEVTSPNASSACDRAFEMNL